MKDPYQVLGVSKTATLDDIKTAYRNLAKKFHPDLNPGNKVAEEKFKDFASAYEKIGTAEARAQFDRGETPEQQQEQARSYHDTQKEGGRYSQSFGGGMGGDDFFENLFRNSRRTRSNQETNLDFAGEDHRYQMSIDFRDSVLGAEQEISLPHGKRLQIKIPPGVESGTKLRFKSQGGPGIGKGPPGDAYVEITVRPLPGFKRVGRNVETELGISFIEAILGAEIKVPTIDGFVVMQVPPGVTTGSRLRIKGKGIADSKEPGDQMVLLKVMMPKKSKTDLEEAVRGWGGKYDYNPRENL